MINGTRPDTNIERKDIKRQLNGIDATVERNAARQLGGGGPQPAAGVDPHGIHPDEAGVLDEGAARAIGRDDLDGEAVRVGAVDVAAGVDGRAARRRRQRERLDVLPQLGAVAVQRRVVQRRVQVARRDPRQAPVRRLEVVVLPARRHFVVVRVHVQEPAVRPAHQRAFGRYGEVAPCGEVVVWFGAGRGGVVSNVGGRVCGSRIWLGWW